MQQIIKTEPRAERPKWKLIAVSEAARKWRSIFVLNPNREYTVGRSSKNNDIHIPSPFCSSRHCILQVTDMEIIMKDQSTHGTQVNGMNYKDSRSILSKDDLLGFGVRTNTKRLKDKTDKKYYVYRVAIGNELESCGPIDIGSSDDDEESNSGGEFNNIMYGDGHDTDDECPSADEMDVKPDIHTLMRTAQEQMKIKEEIGWNAYEYEKATNKEQHNDGEQVVFEEIIPDVEEDVFAVEPPQKRVRRQEEVDYSYLMPDTQTTNHNQTNDTDETQTGDLNQANGQVSWGEYQMSNATLKEKVKNVTRSRGQQLANDMLKSKNTLLSNLNETKTSAPKVAKASFNRQDSQIPSTSNCSSASTSFKMEMHNNAQSVDDFTNEFITELTKWEFKWIYDKRTNPLQFKMNVQKLDIHFPDLITFQRQMKTLLLMEVYSIIFTEYWCRPQGSSAQHTFTQLKSCEFDPNVKRFIYKCFTANKDCRTAEICRNDFAAVTHSNGRFLAYVTQSQRTTDGWEFEMQASPVDGNKNPIKVKYLQIAFITNIQTMLECFISLYELRNSDLQEVFLRPSSQFEGYNSDDDFVKTDRTSILNKVYEKCAVSVFGGTKIVLVNGGTGSGKTTFICDLLQRFSSEQFQVTDSILVCGMNNTLIDKMAGKMMAKIQNIARFGKLSTMTSRVRSIGVEKFSPKLREVNIVFTTLNNAVDLLHANRTFVLCIVDDASLCSEAELLPLFQLKLNTLLLVGDEQLQTSTTQNECCRENGYSRSLFTRVIENYKHFDPKRSLYPTLNQQRRMHPDICLWPNKYFYKQQMKMIAKPTRKTPFVPYTVFQVNTIEDTEIEFVRQLLEFCVQTIKPSKCSYGIVCGHPSSKEQIETMLKEHPQFNGIEVSGYDSFQGQEKDVIIMVALKPDSGFTLFETKENLLIALTRAKESLILCGNFQYVCTNIEAMSSTWMEIISNAKGRKRFFDLNGTYDPVQILNLIS